MGLKLKGHINPMDPNYHSETNNFYFLGETDITKYRMVVGTVNWLVTLGRDGIHYALCTLARHMRIHREGYMHAMKHLFGYILQNCKSSIDYNISELNFSMHKIEAYHWFLFFRNVKKKDPYEMLESKGKSVVKSGFFDILHNSCLVTQSSTTYVYLLVNNTIVKWYTKR